MKRIHFIAIGGAAMHNLAIALKEKGYEVSGSDDSIFEPSRTRLKKHNLLPETEGWNPENIQSNLDAVILGMHARGDNPELLRAIDLGITIYSYPEFLYNQTNNKKRIVIAGSHGKTTITAMIIHVLKYHGLQFDYMVGSKIEGFNNMVGLNDNSEYAVFEGDEYLSSPVDLRPKFMHYKPHIVLISGIAWDHINVFPTFEEYVQQFDNLIHSLAPGAKLYYYKNDDHLQQLVANANNRVYVEAYTEHNSIQNTNTLALLTDKNEKIPIKLFGRHNLQNINGARLVCSNMGITDGMFYEAITDFEGTAKRLQRIHEQGNFTCYLDFAHSPSKARATTRAVREQYPDRKLITLFELHTYSSLNKKFIPHYKGCFDGADESVVYYNRDVLEQKKMEDLSPEFIQDEFQNRNLKVFCTTNRLADFITSVDRSNTVLLFMSSGNFGGIDLVDLVKNCNLK